jgi:hypothetical protein
MAKKPVAVTLRKPQEPVDADAFVVKQAVPVDPIAGAAAIQHAGRDYRELTLYLPTEVARSLACYCMDGNRDVNQVVAEAVRRHVAASAPEPSARRSSWGGTFEILIEQSRLRLIALWALRRVARGG